MQKNDFVNLFYTGYVKTIFEPLEREVPKSKSNTDSIINDEKIAYNTF